MIIRANDTRIRYTGRWNVKGDVATTTANGNYFEFGFVGNCAQIAFSTENLIAPYPHIYVVVDSGALVSTSLNSYHRITCENDGFHHVKVIMKSSLQKVSRWFYPLESRVSLCGIEADGFCTLPPDLRPKIEFIGDSITEGVAIDAVEGSYYADADSPVNLNDSTATFSYLTAKELDFRAYTMGYGRLGICRVGNGDVPPVSQSYGFYSDGEPMESINADYVVINHGTNDGAAESECFTEAYAEFLGIVRERNPKAKIIALTPFGEFKNNEIREAVKRYNEAHGDSVYYLDSSGWISREPLHPLRDGHAEVARRLSLWIRETFLK